ncbi:unnamed protein product [Sphagnum jensenii]|uniref:Uncharacterized protein n=1 Tax=Sphagnum jensenii TaxID=128206 RepID=A0ABP0VFW8_9BRYO
MASSRWSMVDCPSFAVELCTVVLFGADHTTDSSSRALCTEWSGTLGESFYRGTHGALIVYDVNNIGNKVDLRTAMPLAPKPENDIGPLETIDIDSATTVTDSKVATTSSSGSICGGNEVEVTDKATVTTPQNKNGVNGRNNSSSSSSTCSDIHHAASNTSNGSTAAVQPPPLISNVPLWCIKNGYGHVETSAKDGSGVLLCIFKMKYLAIIIHDLMMTITGGDGRFDSGLARI